MKLTVCDAALIAKDWRVVVCETFPLEKLPNEGANAVMVQVPTAISVVDDPLTLQTLGVEEPKMIFAPTALELAARFTFPDPKVLLPGLVNVIVCAEGIAI